MWTRSTGNRHGLPNNKVGDKRSSSIVSKWCVWSRTGIGLLFMCGLRVSICKEGSVNRAVFCNSSNVEVIKLQVRRENDYECWIVRI
jgi:hypothetical protein